MIWKRILLITLSLLSASFRVSARAQSVTLEQAEARFLKNNLLLLAGQYNLDISKALAIQAQAFPNPVFSAEFNLVDPQNKRFLHTGASGQKALGIEQLILLGGKRKSQIEIARKNQALAESELADLLRNLRHELRIRFYHLYQQKTVIEGYNQQLLLLDSLIRNYSGQQTKGNVPLKEVVRLQSVYIRLSSNRAEFEKDRVETLQTLRLLLKDSTDLVPQVEASYFDQLLARAIPADAEQQAKLNRPDLRAALYNQELASLNTRLQKQLAVPDLTISSGYDQRGGAFLNQVNLGFSVPLPVWNRNQGNIEAARANEKLQAGLREQKELEVLLQVQAAVKEMQRSAAQYARAKTLYDRDFEVVLTGMNENFRKRNISLLEFVDFFEAYNESKTAYERIRADLAIAASLINFVTASPIY